MAVNRHKIVALFGDCKMNCPGRFLAQ